ncbi:MAG: DUF4272 domain-containing protein [Bacteroidetes bacterium]|nr:DUF4272 domain-containing protein [Bacteroidota bacterium]
MLCTLYSHQTGFNKITEIVKKNFPDAKTDFGKLEEFQLLHITIKGGLFSAPKKLKIAYRERISPSWTLSAESACPLEHNLRGMYGLVSNIESENEHIKGLLLKKITTLNCEFSIIPEKGEIKELPALVKELAAFFHAILFVQRDTVISRAEGQHFLDENLSLILDGAGHCEITSLPVEIDSALYDAPASELTDDQKKRKDRSETSIRQYNIPVNPHLPCIESIEEVTFRNAQEIAQRVTALATVNLVAFGEINAADAIDYLSKNNCVDYLTPEEKEFLNNPTEEKRNRESWKCEGVWTLLWALHKVDELYFPDRLCNLNDVPPGNFPIGREKSPQEFINEATRIRSKEEILDAADLYYRLDWACVNARINNRSMDIIHPGVVYERHYALNWLISYMNAAWDDITCDT